MIEIPDFNAWFLEIWNKSSLVLIFVYGVVRTTFPNVKILQAIGDCFPFGKKE
ncbi:MAG: hypothetical protein WC373_11800 [Smithella sp.]|jgi:hypothetical protein